MDSSTRNTTPHHSAISLQSDGSSDMMDAITQKTRMPLSEMKPSKDSAAVDENFSYCSTYGPISSDVTSSVMSGVSDPDRKDITTTKDRCQQTFLSPTAPTKCPGPSTTKAMIRSKATVHAPLHQQEQDTTEECRDELPIRHVFSFSQCDQSDEEDTPLSDASDSISASRPRLTLSAFRRPEQTVRMTQSDPSRKLSQEYDLDSDECRILGHGASSTVRLAIRRCDGVKVAVKRIAKHDALRRRRVRRGNRRHLDEWEILQNVSGSPGIVSLLDVFETDEEIQLVMEYCQGGELFNEIRKRSEKQGRRRGRYSEARAACIMSQMLTALCHLHSRGVVHRDVKAENILIQQDQSTKEEDSHVVVKLSDFGLARVLVNQDDSDSSSSDGEASPYTPLSRSRAYSCVGTDYYAAPEVCAGSGYDTAVDIYSLGVTLYVLLCGLPPSYTRDLSSINEESDSDDDVHSIVFPTTHWKDVSPSAKALIRSMLHPDPTQRISAKDALKHEWIVKKSGPDRNFSASIAPRSPVDLELVRTRLYKNMNLAPEEKSRKRPVSIKARSKKRRRTSRRNSSLMVAAAMADLYEGVASAAACASAAAAGIVYDEYQAEVKIVDNEDDNVARDDAMVEFPHLGVTSPCSRLTV